jgi:homospermidine synthase
MDFSKLTIIDFEDRRHLIAETLAAGARYVQHEITRENMAATLAQYVGAGDLVIDLAYSIDCTDIVSWCHDHEVLYINTSVETWDPYEDLLNAHPTERTLYVRHMKLRRQMATWREPGATAVVEHGANPGLVSHWAKVALRDIADAMLRGGVSPHKHDALEAALADADWARLAMVEGVRVIHISERDTQVANVPKRVDEFVNTWSIEGLREEGVAPAELGWGTHERRLPPGAQVHRSGPGNQICLSQMGISTYVRSWVPLGGEIIGMLVRHGEAFTLSDYLTVREGEVPIYRPTVHYAYMPTDAAIASLHEFKMRNLELQPTLRIMNDEIVEGRDELGVLLLGHDLNGWWVGSQLDIHEARSHVPHQNATTLQVAASLLGALKWMIANPREGVKVPDELPYQEVLVVANPYLGATPSVQTDWTPLKHRFDPFERYGTPRPPDEAVWQFGTFLV